MISSVMDNVDVVKKDVGMKSGWSVNDMDVIVI